MTTSSPVVLCILDGWGYSQQDEHNAIRAAKTPHWDQLLDDAPYGFINASEHYVGLPKGQMGNSEVGHMNIGSGRPVRQLLPRINEALEQDVLKDNKALQTFIAKLRASGGACHLMGLCSDGGVHAHLDHIIALAHIVASHAIPVWLHIITDGRDTSPFSARDNGYIKKLSDVASAHDHISIATLGGRYYAMDRDHKWERVKIAYDALVAGIGFQGGDDIMEALEHAYERDGEGDEFIRPIVMDAYERMYEKDGVLFANFRPDRARQLMAALTMKEFDGFATNIGELAAVLGMADYWSEDCPLDIPAIFPMEQVEQSLGQVLAEQGKTQLRIAETEKFNHVTFFFSGGNGKFAGEDRILINSPDVATYDLKPEMSAYEVTEKLSEAIRSKAYDFIVVNYANPDMVGHTGKMGAAIQAVETVDDCLGTLFNAIDSVGGVLLVSADHGNVDVMQDKQGQPHTQHTTNPVPFVAYGIDKANATIGEGGKLADIAPTILSVMGLPIPQQMSGVPLISYRNATLS